MQSVIENLVVEKTQSYEHKYKINDEVKLVFKMGQLNCFEIMFVTFNYSQVIVTFSYSRYYFTVLRFCVLTIIYQAWKQNNGFDFVNN